MQEKDFPTHSICEIIKILGFILVMMIDKGTTLTLVKL